MPIRIALLLVPRVFLSEFSVAASVSPVYNAQATHEYHFSIVECDEQLKQYFDEWIDNLFGITSHSSSTKFTDQFASTMISVCWSNRPIKSWPRMKQQKLRGWFMYKLCVVRFLFDAVSSHKSMYLLQQKMRKNILIMKFLCLLWRPIFVFIIPTQQTSELRSHDLVVMISLVHI